MAQIHESSETIAQNFAVIGMDAERSHLGTFRWTTAPKIAATSTTSIFLWNTEL
jgi:hypothetical protein